MGSVGRADLFDGLPAPGALLDPKGERASVFALVRTWVKALSARGDLAEAGRILGPRYRCAVLCLVSRESAGGVRRSQAQEVLQILGGVAEWAPQAALSLADLEAAAALLAEQPPPAALCAARSGAMQEALEGLPERDALEDPASGQEVFSKLYAWVKARQKPLARLAEAAMWVDLDHRRSIFAFLCGFMARKTVMRSRCREAILQLASLEEWCAGDAADQTMLSEALADEKGLPRRTLCRDKGVGEQRPDGASAPRGRRHPDEVASPGSKAVAQPVGRRKLNDEVGSLVSPGAPAAARLADWRLSRHRPAAGAQASAAAEAPPGGLPPCSALESPEGDGREVFRAIKDAVRESRHAGQLDQLARELGSPYRRNVFTFLCGFAERRTVFRAQARALLRQLSESHAWLDGGAADVEAIERALAVESDLRGSQDGSTSPRAAGSDSRGGQDGSTSPRAAGRDSSQDGSTSPKGSGCSQDGSSSPRAEAGLPELPLDDAWGLDLQLPSSNELRCGADKQALFRRVVVWVLVNSEKGRLGEEGGQLTVEHRGAVLSLVCGFAAPRGRKAQPTFRVLAQKVLRELEGCEEWRAGRLPRSAEVADALKA